MRLHDASACVSASNGVSTGPARWTRELLRTFSQRNHASTGFYMVGMKLAWLLSWSFPVYMARKQNKADLAGNSACHFPPRGHNLLLEARTCSGMLCWAGQVCVSRKSEYCACAGCSPMRTSAERCAATGGACPTACRACAPTASLRVGRIAKPKLDLVHALLIKIADMRHGDQPEQVTLFLITHACQAHAACQLAEQRMKHERHG